MKKLIIVLVFLISFPVLGQREVGQIEASIPSGDSMAYSIVRQSHWNALGVSSTGMLYIHDESKITYENTPLTVDVRVTNTKTGDRKVAVMKLVVSPMSPIPDGDSIVCYSDIWYDTIHTPYHYWQIDSAQYWVWVKDSTWVEGIQVDSVEYILAPVCTYDTIKVENK